MKIVSIVGARPQFVKLAPFSRTLRKRHQEIIVHTGQHYDSNMSVSFFEDLDIPKPDRYLVTGAGGQARQIGRMMEGIEEILLEEKPDAIVVFGDTNSTLAGALAAAKTNIPVVHIEAGLRSFNRTMPEEINRILTDHASDWLFAPTARAMAHLEREGLGGRAYLCGDIMVDAVTENRQRAEKRTHLLKNLDLKAGAYTVLTLHRPYTVDDPELLVALLDKLDEIGETVLFPVHPRTRKTLANAGRRWNNGNGDGDVQGRGRKEPVIWKTGNLRMIEPVGYLDFLCLQSYAKRILTDSGGIQKEAYLLRKPCVTLRPETEWEETVDAGWNLLLPPDSASLAERILQFHPPEEQPAVFGENVSAGILEKLSSLTR